MGAGRLCSARRAPQLFHTAFCATLLAALLVYDTGLLLLVLMCLLERSSPSLHPSPSLPTRRTAAGGGQWR